RPSNPCVASFARQDFVLQLAESCLTRPLFRQIVARIEAPGVIERTAPSETSLATRAGSPRNLRDHFRPRRRPMRTVRLLSLVVMTVVLLASFPVAAQQPVAPPPPQIPYGTPISLEQAKKAVAAAEAESKKNQWNMVIAVLDTGGHLVMLERMDGVQLGSIG